MNGVSFITDDTNCKVAVQIDLQTLEQHQKDVEDLLDGIVASMREDAETISPDYMLKRLPQKTAVEESIGDVDPDDFYERFKGKAMPRRYWASYMDAYVRKHGPINEPDWWQEGEVCNSNRFYTCTSSVKLLTYLKRGLFSKETGDFGSSRNVPHQRSHHRK